MTKRVSKFLSLILRHKPEVVNLTLDKNGWVGVDELLKALSTTDTAITREELEEVVANNDKQRFAFNETRTKIRASQGHSLSGIRLDLDPTVPPDVLFHGTSYRNLSSILATGIHSARRNHVHLSESEETARVVGARHGKPVVLKVLAKMMYEDGHKFYLSENGVWLTHIVPVRYLEL